MNKYSYSMRHIWICALSFSIVMLLCTNPGYAQTSTELPPEVISISNIDKLESLASWQPDNELLSFGTMIVPARNEDVALVENRLNSSVGIIDLKGLKLEPLIHFTSGDILWDVAISPNGQVAATRSLKVADIWDTSTEETIFHAEVPDDTSEMNEMGFSSDSQQFAYATSSYPNTSPQDGVYVYDVTTGKQIEMFKHPSAIVIAFSPDGKYLASGGGDGSVRLWDLGTGDFTEIRQADGNIVDKLDFAASNLLALELETQTKPTLEYWDVIKKESLPIENSRLYSEYRTDGIAQIRMDDGISFQLWSVLQQKDLALLKDVQFVSDIDVNNNLVITSPAEVSDKGIQFRTLDTGEIVHTINEPNISQALFSASGKYVIAWGPTGYLEVWGIRQ